jgi:cytidine deaminase
MTQDVTPMPTHQDLLDESAKALRQAYAPYSQLYVGAALRSASGNVYSGCNVESGSFSVGSCAERNAISAAVRAEGPSFQLLEIAISATDRSGQALPIPPCGACRQMIREFGNEAQVYFLGAGGSVIHAAIGDLLPHSFSLAT